jgi:catechol 2,3-dioxygenase
MTYSYRSNIRLGEVVLNVSDLSGQINFYNKVIGLAILHQSGDEALLGLRDSQQVLVRLIKTDLPVKAYYGLFHMAILVPDRSALGAALKHILLSGTNLTGGADHGYSEAIYLDDLEGNGIEIYCDKPVEEWDVREDGRIIGVTEELDATGILASSQDLDDYYLSEETVIGHVHLSVRDALAASKRYQKIFDLDDKLTIPSASWIASGNYHHHLAFNHWAGPKLLKREKNRPGLNYFSIVVQNSILFKASLKKAILHSMPILEQSDTYYFMEDEDGLRIKVILEND